MKVYICDDKRDDLKKYEKQIRDICGKHGIQLELMLYESGKKMLFDIEDDVRQPDVIYLDIHLEGEDGTEVAEALRRKQFKNEIIFLTASEKANHILYGYDVEAMHYVIKNKTPKEKFEQIFLWAFEKVSNRKREVINFSCAGESCTVPVDESKYFEVKRKVITVYYREDSFEFYSTMDKIENMLCRKGFIRVHRSYIVSLQYVVRAAYDELVLEDGTKLPMGRNYQKLFREIWNEYQIKKTA